MHLLYNTQKPQFVEVCSFVTYTPACVSNLLISVEFCCVNLGESLLMGATWPAIIIIDTNVTGMIVLIIEEKTTTVE